MNLCCPFIVKNFASSSYAVTINWNHPYLRHLIMDLNIVLTGTLLSTKVTVTSKESSTDTSEKEAEKVTPKTEWTR